MRYRLNPDFDWLLWGAIAFFLFTMVVFAIAVFRLVRHFPVNQSTLTVAQRQEVGFDLFFRIFSDRELRTERWMVLLGILGMAVLILTLAVLMPLLA
ncbi:MAG TPA: hypothetical protein VGN80_01885 [Devosiaceae bacterium]|jgi:hypothetical protein|nr:hypothetical protein [Devosiaceae bacterium]